MKATIAIAALVCASAVLATPITEFQYERLERHGRRGRREAKAGTILPSNIIGGTNIEGAQTTDDVVSSDNWAGALITGTDITSVSATITAPSVQVPSGKDPNIMYVAAFWVGIDGFHSVALFQVGITCTTRNICGAWYEWYPNRPAGFPDVTVSPGDTVTLTATLTSSTSGDATVLNASNNQTQTKTLSGQIVSLIQTSAEWVIEDPRNAAGLAPFADFGKFSFTGCSAVNNGQTVDTTGATILVIEQHNETLTSCSNNGGAVDCKFIG